MDDFTKWNAAIATTCGVFLGSIATGAFAALTPREGADILSRADWLQFTATLIGSAMTLAAGWFAYRAVQDQIKSMLALAREKDDGAWLEIKKIISETSIEIQITSKHAAGHEDYILDITRKYSVNRCNNIKLRILKHSEFISPSRRSRVDEFIALFDEFSGGVNKCRELMGRGDVDFKKMRWDLVPMGQIVSMISHKVLSI